MGKASEMNYSIEYRVRHKTGRLLREMYPGRFFCTVCLATFLRGALGTAFTKGQIERALQTVSKTPGAMTYKQAFICDQCGKTAPCLGAKWTQPEPSRTPTWSFIDMTILVDDHSC